MIVSILSMALATVTPIPAASTLATAKLTPPAGRPIVIGHSYVMHSAILASDRRINVYLPPDYGEAGKAFPILYLLDGGEREDFVHIAGLAQITSAYGDGREMIVVGIEGVDRRHDLTAPSAIASDLTAAPTSGGAAAYRRFLTDELKPWVTARFKTDGKSAIIGESLAGLFVLDTLLTQPSAFDDFIAVSPSLWWNGGRTAIRLQHRYVRHIFQASDCGWGSRHRYRQPIRQRENARCNKASKPRSVPFGPRASTSPWRG